MAASMVDTDITADVYRQAAVEHVAVSSELYDLGHYVLANYTAGLAVESMLRAYRLRIDPEFDSRHDLLRLFKLSRFADLFPQSRTAEYSQHMSAVASQWSNNHRYRSDKALRAYLKRGKLDRSVKRGDFLKELTRRLVHSATEMVTLGAERWQT